MVVVVLIFTTAGLSFSAKSAKEDGVATEITWLDAAKAVSSIMNFVVR